MGERFAQPGLLIAELGSGNRQVFPGRGGLCLVTAGQAVEGVQHGTRACVTRKLAVPRGGSLNQGGIGQAKRTHFRPRFSGHGYPTQRAPNTSSPRPDVLRRWSQATGPCDGTTARRCLCLRTGSGITEARPHPRALPPPGTTWTKWTNRVYFVPQSEWPFSRSLRASEGVDPSERGGNDGAVSRQSQLCGCLSLSE